MKNLHEPLQREDTTKPERFGSQRVPPAIELAVYGTVAAFVAAIANIGENGIKSIRALDGNPFAQVQKACEITYENIKNTIVQGNE